MVKKVIKWIKLSMPISRREWERVDCDIRRLWMYGANNNARITALENDVADINSKIEIIQKEVDATRIRVDGLSEVVRDSGRNIRTLFEMLNDTNAKIGEFANKTNTRLESIHQRLSKQDIVIASSTKSKPIKDIVCNGDEADITYLTEDDKAIIISVLENRCASLEYQAICSADATVMQDCEKNVIELQQIINKLKQNGNSNSF